MKQKADLVIDTVTQDSLLNAGFSEGSDREGHAGALVQSFEVWWSNLKRHNDRFFQT